MPGSQVYHCDNVVPCKCHSLAQEAVDQLMRQVSELAAPGSRICFDALHRDHMDGRVHNRGFSCGVEVRLPGGSPSIST